MNSDKLGLYIHIPFCVKKCGYCDFCSVADFSLMDNYIEYICNDIKQKAREVSSGRIVDTIYFGGGTPTCTGLGLVRILDAVRSAYNVADDAEISFEANPATADYELLHTLKENGFNRVSIGIQSANEKELKRLGRIHTFDEALKIIENAKKAGFEDVGGDMMLGIPEQTMESMLHTAKEFVKAGMQHISAYMLKIEPNTPFGKNPPSDLPDEDETSDMYLAALEYFKSCGYIRYEISNFALPGYECRHNRKYWDLDEYIGFGPAAHSFFNGRRTAVEGSVADYINGKSVIKDYGEGGTFSEYVMLSLRTAYGLDLNTALSQFGKRFIPDDFFYKMQDNGLITLNDKIYLTDKGVLVSNTVITEVEQRFI